MNEAVGMKNCVMIAEGGKQTFRPSVSQEIWKDIACVLLEVTYEKEGQKLLSKIPKHFGNKAPTKLQRDVCGNTNLYKACCDIYSTFYIYAFHRIILSYTNLFIP